MSSPLSVAVSPAIQKIALSPGETYEGEFSVSSLSSGENLSFSVNIAPLNFKDENYNLDFSVPGTFNQIIDWTSFLPDEDMDSSSVALLSDPDQSRYSALSLPLDNLAARRVRYRITVPEDAPGGGQYLAFLVRGVSADGNDSSDSSLSVKNKSQVAVLLYASVSGETRETGTVLENRVPHFFFNTELKTSSRLENTGNVHLPATDTLRVASLFTNEEVYSSEETPLENTIIPQTSLYSEQTWQDTPVLGLFRVVQDISFAGTTDTCESLVLVAPLWFLGLTLAFVLAILYALFERFSLYKRAKSSLKNL